MSIEESLRQVNDLLTDGNTKTASIPTQLKPLFPYMAERLRQTGTHFAQDGCGLRQDDSQNDMGMWQIALIFAEYVTGLIGQKTEQGVCHRHATPCADGRDFHLKILAKLKDDLRGVIDSITKIESACSSWQPPAKNTGS